MPFVFRLLLLVTILPAGCRQKTEPTVPVELPPPALTAEDAKAAILDLIYAENLENLKEFPIAKYKAMPMKPEPGSPWLFWGKYEINLESKKYQFSETRDEPPKSTRTMWRGEFVYQDGKWLARIPKLMKTTVSGE
ncbi:hypothetical protein [Zavarzinella formosa]|uniref:hypothetical protein n=1 Tax=Zavarzinella formosa TaxID=360055 RepID=UPI0004958455|nr:hypothetical protein [Zavarzinella formosa]